MKLLNSVTSDAMFLSQWIVDFDFLTRIFLESIIKQTNYYLILDNIIPNITLKISPYYGKILVNG
jgi:hypothetical protein